MPTLTREEALERIRKATDTWDPLRRPLDGLDLSGMDFRGEDFSGADLRGVLLTGGNLTDVDLRGADLGGAVLIRALLTGAQFENTTFTGTNLSGADLRGVDLNGLNLADVNLSSADLSGADLRNADLRGARLADSKLHNTHLSNRTAFSGDANLLDAQWEALIVDGKAYNRADIESGKVRLPLGMGGAPEVLRVSPTPAIRYQPYDAVLVDALDALTVERAKRKAKSTELASQIRQKVKELNEFRAPHEGDVVLGCKLLEVIGSGNFGDVYRARPESGAPDVAIKVFHSSKFGLKLTLHSFRRGVEAMEKLRDAPGRPPCVIELLKADKARVAFSMKLATRTDLAEAMDRNWTIETKLRFFGELCRAVNFAHAHKVLHRDIKPENILVTEALQPVLTDFDIADLLYKKTLSSQAQGTVLYAAPEQLEGTADRRFASDIYSLGRILHFLLLAGHPRLALDRIPELDDLKGQRDGLVRITRKCTMRDPTLRYQTVDELLADLERHEAAPESVGVGPSVTPVVQGTPPPEPDTRTRWDRYIAFAFGAVVLGVLLYAGLREKPITDPGQFFILRTVTAVGVAGIASLIPGFLHLTISKGTLFVLRSGGAVAALVLVFLVNPPALVGATKPPPTEQALNGTMPLTSAQGEDISVRITELRRRLRDSDAHATQRAAAALSLIELGEPNCACQPPTVREWRTV